MIYVLDSAREALVPLGRIEIQFSRTLSYMIINRAGDCVNVISTHETKEEAKAAVMALAAFASEQTPVFDMALKECLCIER